MDTDSPHEDSSLWARVGAGDARAFGLLYDRYADRIYSYCFRRTGSWAVAQDLAASVWLEAWRCRGRARLLDDSLAPWLFGIARNVLRNGERVQRRHASMLSRLPSPSDESDHADMVAARLDDERHMTSVLAAVRRLPRREQDVLTLTAWAGLTQTEAAAALGIRVGTVKSRLSRARSRLRTDLNGPATPHNGRTAPVPPGSRGL